MKVRPHFKNQQHQVSFIELMNSDAPIELEIGSGKGLFLIEAAQKNLETQFIGLEISAKFAEASQARIERKQIPNGRFYCCDAVEAMVHDVPSNRIDAVHVYFPDPWWKARHKKRRVLNVPMLTAIQRVLKPSGLLHFWTDVIDYYETTLELIAEVTSLEGPMYVPEPQSVHDMDYRTHFERRTRLNGLPVYRSQYVKPIV